MFRWGVWAVVVLLAGAVSAAAQANIPAQVVAQADVVNAYVLPDLSAPVLAQLNGGAQITALGRSADSAWIQADVANGYVGWVAAGLVQVPPAANDLAALPVTQPDEELILQFAPFWNFHTPHLRQVYERGQARGRRANAFSKVGDSITAAQMYLKPFGYGVYDLGGHDNLQYVLDYFGTDQSSSFYRASAAVRTGWSTRDVLNPKEAERFGCAPGSTPLACEYAFTNPAFALIMLGTNDATMMTVDEFEANLNTIVEITLAADVVPVLSTVPPLLLPQWSERPYNHAIIRVALAHDVALINYWLPMQSLPNAGMSDDYVHPSAPPSNAGTTLFTPPYLQYGYTVRNLTTLQGLDLLLRHTLEP
jgi:hypothetical protein